MCIYLLLLILFIQFPQMFCYSKENETKKTLIVLKRPLSSFLLCCIVCISFHCVAPFKTIHQLF